MKCSLRWLALSAMIAVCSATWHNCRIRDGEASAFHALSVETYPIRGTPPFDMGVKATYKAVSADSVDFLASLAVTARADDETLAPIALDNLAFVQADNSTMEVRFKATTNATALRGIDSEGLVWLCLEKVHHHHPGENGCPTRCEDGSCC